MYGKYYCAENETQYLEDTDSRETVESAHYIRRVKVHNESGYGTLVTKFVCVCVSIWSLTHAEFKFVSPVNGLRLFLNVPYESFREREQIPLNRGGII
jgi:hypothetical protein